jgi:hypothetical protein
MKGLYHPLKSFLPLIFKLAPSTMRTAERLHILAVARGNARVLSWGVWTFGRLGSSLSSPLFDLTMEAIKK